MDADFCPTCGNPQIGVHYHETPAKPVRRRVERSTKGTANDPISRLAEFQTNGALSARGHSGPGDQLLFGRLQEPAVSAIKSLPDVNYVVSSYGTPIGVHSESQGWVIPKQKFSVTTSNHQGALRRGAAASGRPVKEV